MRDLGPARSPSARSGHQYSQGVGEERNAPTSQRADSQYALARTTTNRVAFRADGQSAQKILAAASHPLQTWAER